MARSLQHSTGGERRRLSGRGWLAAHAGSVATCAYRSSRAELGALCLLASRAHLQEAGICVVWRRQAQHINLHKLERRQRACTVHVKLSGCCTLLHRHAEPAALTAGRSSVEGGARGLCPSCSPSHTHLFSQPA